MKHAVVLPFAAILITTLPVPPARAGADGIFSSVSLTSDYRYQGVSNSDRHAAVQGNVHYFRSDGWYLGAFATEVDFNDVGTSFEVDVYGGRNLRLDSKTELKLDAMYTAFPDNRTPGPTYDFWQAKAALTRKDGPLTVIGLVSYVPKASYGSGDARRVEGEAQYAITPHLTLKAQAGRRWIERGADRDYWSVGAATTWKHLTLEVRHQDTNLSRARCGYNPDICGPALTGTLSAALPLILFR